MDNYSKTIQSIVKKVLTVFLIIFLFFIFIQIAGALFINNGLTNTAGIIDYDFKLDNTWKNTEEWISLKESIQKEASTIKSVAKIVNINPRIIVSLIVVEQMRLYFDNRELFQKVFLPLKMMGKQTQFSWGILGLKEKTAIEIEKNLKKVDSDFYLGKDYENLLDFKTKDPEKIDGERFERITNQKDNYYSYLYSAIYIKQIIKQWQKYGYDIENKPGILATLYNIGFINSIPKKDPKIGGSTLLIGDSTYSFGGLAENFYYSDQLLDIFPR